MTRVVPVSIENRTVSVPDAVFSYRLYRENRRTLVLRLGEAGLEAHAPLGMPTVEVEAFLAEKRQWIQKHLTRQEEAQSWAEGFQFRHGGRFMYRGHVMGLLLGAAKTTLVERGGYPVLYAALREDASEIRVRGFLRGWLAAQAAKTYPGRVALLAQKTGVAPSAVHLTDAVSFWGQCDSRGVIKLSWRLVLFDEAVSDYVIAHELAHLVHMDHSPWFWALVARVDPGYKKHEAQLKSIRIREIPL